MTLDTPTLIALAGLVISALGCVGAFSAGLYSFFITPYRVQQLERRIEEGDKRFAAIEANGNGHSVSLGELKTAMTSMATDLHSMKATLDRIFEIRMTGKRK